MLWFIGFIVAIALAVFPAFRHLPLALAVVFLSMVVSPLAALALLGAYVLVQAKRRTAAW